MDLRKLHNIGTYIFYEGMKRILNISGKNNRNRNEFGGYCLWFSLLTTQRKHYQICR